MRHRLRRRSSSTQTHRHVDALLRSGRPTELVTACPARPARVAICVYICTTILRLNSFISDFGMRAALFRLDVRRLRAELRVDSCRNLTVRTLCICCRRLQFGSWAQCDWQSYNRPVVISRLGNLSYNVALIYGKRYANAERMRPGNKQQMNFANCRVASHVCMHIGKYATNSTV